MTLSDEILIDCYETQGQHPSNVSAALRPIFIILPWRKSSAAHSYGKISAFVRDAATIHNYH